MLPLDTTSTAALIVASYLAAIVSAILPWVNGEVLLLAAVPTAAGRGAVLPLVIAFTLGQMTGKSAMYWLTRSATGRRSPRVAAAIERWRDRFEQHPHLATGLVFVSAALGLPPFYAISIAAGGLRMPFGTFVVAGGAGRFVHFGLLAYAPQALGFV